VDKSWGARLPAVHCHVKHRPHWRLWTRLNDSGHVVRTRHVPLSPSSEIKYRYGTDKGADAMKQKTKLK